MTVCGNLFSSFCQHTEYPQSELTLMHSMWHYCCHVLMDHHPHTGHTQSYQKVCRYFQNGHHCKYGVLCKYPHLVITDHHPCRGHRQKDKKLCKYLQKNNLCKYGCTANRTVCHRFAKYGDNGCKYGDKCKYAHSPSQTPLQEDADKKCIICQARPLSAAFIHENTSHMCTCIECALELWSHKTGKYVSCPMCRQLCLQPIQVYVVS